ncbi:Cof subfamily protein (haloacid dehalogenase superfamily) [Kribbella aluminosa]|uniref:Cof subfamily protein (Haloacid dehalogenase superfamily) n=1 Tax=Kribbella aluminosa TaxID=416017 RepID=A0ABS4UQW9_9ACTN|nr:HAD family hydrolase [Kribbella aluminosa]MBP2354032.1 Cof subfamily protein (haloacid dehalogenase superfamily) [Kribbella aluminosa]
MTGQPTVVALDIDGTLIDHDDAMSPAVLDAVRRAAAQVPVVLATGRAWSTTKPIAERLGLPAGGFVVCSNGARTLRYPDGAVVDERTFDPSTVIASVRRYAPNARMAVEDSDGSYLVTEPFPDGDLGVGARFRVVGDDELAPQPVTRLIIRDPEQSESDFVQLAERLGLHGVSYFVGWTAWLDIAPEGVDKSTGLKVALAQLDLDPSGLLAIGDGRNDIEMLTYAAVGVAMGSAPEEVKLAADEVTKSVQDDGVAAVLNRWF